MEGTLKRPGRKTRAPKKAALPGTSERFKAMWARPGFREHMLAMRKADPQRWSRKGVPDGMKRKDANKLWAKARAQADEWIKMLEDEGSLELDYKIVPDSDAEKAKLALREAAAMALGPADNRTKLMAINTVLAYTKEKPTQKVDNTVRTSEDWLKAALEASKSATV